MLVPKRHLLISLFGSVLFLSGCTEKIANGQSLPPPPRVVKKSVSFEVQLETFQKLGFTLTPGIDFSVVDGLRKDKTIEDRPYAILYMELGRTIQKEPWTPLTNRVWDFDVEAVEDQGAYVEIIKNLERITRGEIKFVSVKDHVDIENENAWVSFSVRGKNYKWNLAVEDDYADPELFARISQLTQTLNTKGRFTYFNTGGQNAVIGYETPESKEAIIKATGLKIEWLN